jgi:hypothetical protein
MARLVHGAAFDAVIKVQTPIIAPAVTRARDPIPRRPPAGTEQLRVPQRLTGGVHVICIGQRGQ